MIDREKVIADLRRFINYPEPLSGTVKDALELLKEQEPKSAIIEGSDVAHVGRCPSCHVILTPFRANYCYCCGEAVKWDATD